MTRVQIWACIRLASLLIAMGDVLVWVQRRLLFRAARVAEHAAHRQWRAAGRIGSRRLGE